MTKLQHAVQSIQEADSKPEADEAWVRYERLKEIALDSCDRCGNIINYSWSNFGTKVICKSCNYTCSSNFFRRLIQAVKMKLKGDAL